VMVLLQSATRGVGDAVTPLWSTIVNLLMSLVLNPVFILGWGPVPAMGLAGAAAAGVLANVASLVFTVWRIYALDLPIRLRGPELRLLRPDWAHLKPVLVIGLPMGVSMIVTTVASLLMLGLINREGVETVAAYNATTQIWNYVQMPAFAVGGAVSAMAAQNIGAGRWDRVGRIAGAGVTVNVVMTGVLVTLLILADHWLLALFLPAGSPAIAIGEHINLLIGWTFVPMGISMVITSVVRANGAVIVPFAILVVTVIGIRMSLGFGFYPVYGADAIWWAFIASSSCSATLAVIYYLSGAWRKERPVRHAPAAAAAPAE